MRVVVLSGSLSRGSLNSRLADQIGIVASSGTGRPIEDKSVIVDRLRLADVAAPNYDADAEITGGLPEGPERLADAMKHADGVIICSPEYNASMPGALKNVIDWVSRLRPQPFAGQRGMLASASPSLIGGNRGLWSLRVPLEQLGMHVHPEMYSLARANERLDDPDFLDTETGHRLTTLVNAFLDEARHLATTGATHG